jgi:phage gp29-like protein
MADAPIIYGPDGEPIRRELLKTSIAGPTISGVRSPFSGYPGDGLNPRRLASLLRDADQGEPMRFFELAEQIEERDLHYAGVLGTRKRSVAQLDIQVDAATEEPIGIAHADMVREWLNRDELQDELFDMLDAIGKGISFTEIVWDTSEGQWRPGKLEWRDPRWFRFDRKDGATPLLRGDDGDVPLPPFKFIKTVIRAKSGLPVRSGIARLATWSWMFKAFTLRDWAIFTQTFGQPIRVGKYPAGSQQADKDTLFKAVANIAGDCAAIIPESMVIDFIEAANIGASHALYKERADWLDQQISKAVIGQTATTDAIAGGHAVGQEHRQVQEDIERADAKALAAIINRDLIRPWIDLEFGPQKKYPQLRIGRPDSEDLDKLTANIVRMVPLGLRVEKSWMNDKLGIPDPDPGAELLTPPASGMGLPFSFPALNAAAPTARATGDTIAALNDQAQRLCAPGMAGLIDEVRAVIDRCTSLQQVQDELKKLKPGLAQANLAGLMQMARVVANLTGRADIADA